MGDNSAGAFITPEKTFRLAALDRAALATDILALRQKGNLPAWQSHARQGTDAREQVDPSFRIFPKHFGCHDAVADIYRTRVSPAAALFPHAFFPANHVSCDKSVAARNPLHRHVFRSSVRSSPREAHLRPPGKDSKQESATLGM